MDKHTYIHLYIHVIHKNIKLNLSCYFYVNNNKLIKLLLILKNVLDNIAFIVTNSYLNNILII